LADERCLLAFSPAALGTPYYALDVATWAMFKIIKRLDPEQQCNELPEKPKGMHWRTYNRLEERYCHFDARWALAVMWRLRIKL
jgi:hypothetical protein